MVVSNPSSPTKYGDSLKIKQSHSDSVVLSNPRTVPSFSECSVSRTEAIGALGLDSIASVPTKV